MRPFLQLSLDSLAYFSLVIWSVMTQRLYPLSTAEASESHLYTR